MKLFLFILNLVFISDVVKSECDDPFKCIGEIISRFFESVNISNPNLKVSKLSENDTLFVSPKEILNGISNTFQNESESDLKIYDFENADDNNTILIKIIQINDGGEPKILRNDTLLNNADVKDINNFIDFDIKDEEEPDKEVSLSSKELNKTDNSPGKKTFDTFRSAIENEVLAYLNEIKNIDSDYYGDDINSFDDNSTDYPMIDYVELYKDTTNEPNDALVTEVNEFQISDAVESVNVSENEREGKKIVESMEYNGNCRSEVTKQSTSKVVFPWIATIFIKNGTSTQFEYFCDGIILSERNILTSARCLHIGNKTIESSDIIVIMGKTSLSNSEENHVYRIKEIKLHEDFVANDEFKNDLAILTTEDKIEFNEKVEKACFLEQNDGIENITDAITTGWQQNGELTTIHFDTNAEDNCDENPVEKQFCDMYGFDVAICPNYGGVYAVKTASDLWNVKGISREDPSKRGLCLNKKLRFTDLTFYRSWLELYSV